MSLNPLEQLNVVVMMAVAAIWLATFVVLRRVLLLPLLAVMERRQQKLDASSVIEREARALLEDAQQAAAKITDAAKAAAERTAADTKDELSREREARLAVANQRARDVLTRGREEIASMRAAEHAKLEQQLVLRSRQALLKLTPGVDEDALRIIVARVLAGGAR